MSSNPLALKISKLSKSYKISSRTQRNVPKSFREDLMALLKRSFSSGGHDAPETFWALKDLDLEVKRGEKLAIVGSNGSGKSTLLKLISRITRPTSGKIELFGKVGALLELGAGFHTDLTGRENIYLSGAILGMKQHEIDAKFDQIVEFSELVSFLDLPVKRYSSGMFLKLAFSVISHLNSDILIADEILSAGDGDFQKKSLQKMKEIAQENRTVIYVTHHVESILSFCPRTIWIQNGKIVEDGPSEVIVEKYLCKMHKKT